MQKSAPAFSDNSLPSGFCAKIELVPLRKLRASRHNARTHSPSQIEQIAASIREFGFVAPIVIDGKNTIVAGHGRVEAAKRLDLKEAPCVRVEHLTETQRRAFMIADNKIAMNAGWNEVQLAEELKELSLLDPELDLRLTGFTVPEIDELLDDAPASAEDPKAERLPKTVPARVQPGDIWQLGPHRVICGDARRADVLEALLGADKAQMVFTDPPYNVPIAGNVSSRGQIAHDEFVLASGEMTEAEFEGLLRDCFENLIRFSVDGSIHFVCMDWRHLREVLEAGRLFAELKNLVVWDKGNGGKGSFYRSQHEMVFVFKNGSARHINNFGLGQGRNRTNVWNYRGMTSRSKMRDEALEMHPTVKPVAMIADAIKDVSAPNGIVLDVFGGSGSTLIAAHKTGRRARIVEIDPTYCDRILKRWEDYAKDQAVQVACGRNRGQP